MQRGSVHDPPAAQDYASTPYTQPRVAWLRPFSPLPWKIDRIAAWTENYFDITFVGDDWRGSESWQQYEADFATLDVKVIYFPYSLGVSSTILRERLGNTLLASVTPTMADLATSLQANADVHLTFSASQASSKHGQRG